MAKVIAYQVEYDGIQSAITNQEELTQAIKETKAEFRGADFGTQKYKQLEAQLGGLKKVQQSINQDVRDQGREYEIAADKGKGSYRALNAELVNLRRRFKELSAEERRSDIGAATLANIQKLDAELKEIDASMGQFQRNVGNYQAAFQAIGGVDIASLATVPGAVLAGTAAIKEAIQFVGQLTEEFRQLRGEVQALTDSTGEELDEFTSRIIAIGDTFDEEQKDILNAANSLTDQLTGNFSESLDIIQTGLAAGLNINGEFLDSLREYPTFFAEAGLSANQFLNIVARQVQTGVFSDKGVDAIKEATIRLRELPNSTRDALQRIGTDSEQIRKKITDEGIGAAIEEVSRLINQLEADSPEVGQAVADIFGGAGEDAGIAFIQSLEDISGSTEGLIDQGNEYQQQQLRSLEINEEFTRVQAEVANAIGGTGATLSDVGTILQTRFLQFVVFIVERFQAWWQAIEPLRESLGRLGSRLSDIGERLGIAEGATSAFNLVLGGLNLAANLVAEGIAFIVDGLTSFIDTIVDAAEFLGIIDEGSRELAETTKTVVDETKKETAAVRESTEAKKESSQQTDDLDKKLKNLTLSTKAAAVATDVFAKDSIKGLSSEVSKLKKELDSVDPDDQEAILVKLLGAEKALEDAKQFQAQLREQLTRNTSDVPLLAPLPISPATSTGEQTEQGRLNDIEATKNARINAAREVATNDQQLALQTQQIESEAALAAAQVRLDNEELTAAERIKLNQEVADRQVEIERLKSEQIFLIEQERQEKLLEIANGVFSSIALVNNELAAATADRYAAEEQRLTERYEREIELAEGNQEEQERLSQELAERREQIRREEFQAQKKFRRAAAFASLAEGIVNILASPTTIPQPFAEIYKGLQIGILTATTIAQVARINRQQAAKGFLFQDEKKPGWFTRARKIMARGGRIVRNFARGASHDDPSGGIHTRLNGVDAIIENGEFVDYDEFGGIAVVNKRSSARFMPQLKNIAGKVFPGKRRYLSAINQDRSHGIAFAQEGTIIPDLVSATGSDNIVRQGAGNTVVTVSPESIAMIAGSTARAVEIGAERGVSKGTADVNRRAEREERLQERIES